MPYTTVVPGTTITAAWGNANVRDQVVTPFASYAAMTSAITAPTNGMLAFLTDTLFYWYYRNGSWRLLPGQVMYGKWDTATSFFTNQVAGAYTTAFTTGTFNVPSSGTGQCYEINWQCPHTSGTGTVTRYNSQIQGSINGGAFNLMANSGPVYVNSIIDTWTTKGIVLYKAGGTDTTIALRVQSISVGGNFDCIAAVANPFAISFKSMGLLATEVV